MLLKHYLLRVVTISLLLLSFGFAASAQLLNHVQGRVLVQLDHLPAEQTAKSWFAAQTDAAGKSLGLKFEHVIHRHSRIYMVSFDHDLTDENLVLTHLRSHQQVQNAQFDHFVKTRAEPNDPEFPNQWQYLNVGQSGGTVGADIDADLAWDVTTGGITADGDTIVACIIDDGIDADHPDMAPNLWINYAEIPNNGIDDDSNGYVDDYRGWDTGSNSDAVYDGGGHGTPVAGIVGARGNDGFGAAGVNWNVKLMIVQGGTGVESEVLEAYGYPLDARMAYNASAGGKGAFVVSTNASWGVDFGQPDDSPLWCAFYDTLGVHGILNCGATINGNQNVDVVGDLPTACPSDYLISVTNMNDDDVKVTGAGFGVETIDMGAFGQGTWTPQAGGGFGGFGGTSGATPHVTGTIALLYSLPCPDIITLAKTDPGAAALLMKQAIFDGLDENASLQGITATGGRLNLNNAVQNVLGQCGGCLPPLNAEATVESDSQAVITYTLLNDTTVNQMDLRFRIIGTDEWTLFEDVMSPFTLNDLLGCTDYEFQFQAFCDTTNSEYSRSFEFSTLGCCENPEDFALVSVDSFSIDFAWSSVYAAVSYELETRPAGTMDWNVNSTMDTSITIDGLEPCTELEYRFRVICSDTTQADYTNIQTITTAGCGACVDLTYCATNEISVVDEWIANVSLGDIDNSSGAGEGGYTDFTVSGQTTTITGGIEVEFTLTTGYAATVYGEGWAIFIDLNANGNFDDAGERVWQSPGDEIENSVSGSFTLPFNVPNVYTRMRVGMNFSDYPDACSANSIYGEYEDYCVSLMTGMEPECIPPAGLSHVDEPGNDSTATLNWEAAVAAESYMLRYRLESVVEWTEMEAQTTEVTLIGLDSCANYEAQVRSDCGVGNDSGFSESLFFSTACISNVRSFDIGLNDWSVAPNPTRGDLVVRFDFNESPREMGVRLFSQFGRELSYRSLTPTASGTVNVELNDLPAGVYYLRLETEQGSSRVRKVVKF
ncbi:hypothetical protein CEQ90_08550 [Lewinellaceae bacterium SD302]|nr:hypothetical protein CEQ90_08550 [Lewinellaceae bacterium SD302]